MTEKNPRQITAQARLPQVTTSARKLSVGKYLYLALTKQWPLTGVQFYLLNLFIETKLAAVQTLLQKEN